ncbi:hypothetical protein [Actinomadura sp. DC4]|uniref:hypothetical protein n=1 Tax=Actinomadura sp. DC4 TaxID=3055069 RepID=UPI0025AFA78C|nr:hypothetical protein [Actinomadura sp. DC4]MDN3351319.1 hypothetical protein [Actinomadura sp. DC4]
MGPKPWERWAVTIVGLALAAGGVALGAGPYNDRRAFEKAGYCGESTSSDGCIARMRMTVVSKSTYTTHDPDPDWPPPQPPPQPPPMPPPFQGPFRIAPAVGGMLASLPMSDTVHYELTVRTEDGARHKYAVGHTVYDAAKPGTAGVAEVWHGHVRRLRIGADSHEEWSYWSLGLSWVLAWIGVMLIAGWGLSLAGVPLPIVIGAWWGGVIVFTSFHDWRPAIWVIPAIFAGAVLTLRVSATIMAARRPSRW